MLKTFLITLTFAFAASHSFAEEPKPASPVRVVCPAIYIPLFNIALEGFYKNATPIVQALELESGMVELSGVKVLDPDSEGESDLIVEISGILYPDQGLPRVVGKNFKMELDECGQTVVKVTPVN